MSECRDAEEVDVGPMIYSQYRIEPGHPYIWLRLDGAWHDAVIHHWQRHDGVNGPWFAWIEYDDPTGDPWPKMGMFRYDEAAIVPRYDKTKPA